MKLFRLSLLLVFAAVLSGCRSRVVLVNLVNTSAQPLHTIVVDYPGATFGVDRLDPGKTYEYPIKPLQTGPLKVQFADAAGKPHSFTGPTLQKNEEGMLEVKLDQENAAASLHPLDR